MTQPLVPLARLRLLATFALASALAPGCSLSTHFDDFRPDDPTEDGGTDAATPDEDGGDEEDGGDDEDGGRDSGLDAGEGDAGPIGTVVVTVAGGGSVTDGAALDCDEAGGAACTASYPEGALVTLSAVETASARFVGWTGGGSCDGTALTTCEVTVSGSVAVTATFEPIVYQLSVSVTGGQARVMTAAALMPAIDCDRDGDHVECSASYLAGTSITLDVTEIPAGFSFAAWGGDSVGCTAAACTFVISADTTLTANLSDGRPVLTVSASNGSVASDDMLIACPTGACASPYTSGTMVRLVPTPDLGYRFVAWTGCGAAMGGSVGADQSCTMTLSTSRSVTANFTLLQFDVGVTRSGGGSGTVTSTLPSGTIACGSDCDETAVDYGTTFVLRAVPNSGSRFAGWTGGSCTGLTGDCSFDLTSSVSLTATFELLSRTVTTHVVGTGSVSSAPAGIACATGDTGSCSLVVDNGDSVVLTASPATGYTFTGWSTSPGGLCSGTGTCSLTTISQNITANATFTLNRYDLNVLVTAMGGAAGSVVATDSGGTSASCSTGTCTSMWDYNTTVTLTATAVGVSTFTGWGGACSAFGASTTCTVSMTAIRNVSASFAPATASIQIVKTGGNGTVTSTVPDTRVNCGATCTVDYTMGQMVTLVAAPATGYTFVGWSGVAGCGASATCVVTVGSSTTVATATFAALSYTVMVTTTGIPAGSAARVTSDVGGINCPGTCSTSLTHGTVLNLTAVADSGASFVSWATGPCAGSAMATCNTTVTGAVNASATFTPVRYRLDVVKGGMGTVTLTGVTPSVTCGPSCSMIGQDINFGTMVTLTATPSTGLIFGGWSGGGCSGTAPCTVTMNVARSVTATFRQPILTISVTTDRGGLGGGPAVASTTPSGLIRCGGSSAAASACSGSVAVGTAVTLQVQRAWLEVNSWGGTTCDTGAPCTVTVTNDLTIAIELRQRGNLAFVGTLNYLGNAGVSADSVCESFASTAGLPGTYRAWIGGFSGGTAVGAYDRLRGDVVAAGSTGWVRTDGYAIANSFSDFASGFLVNPIVTLPDGTLVPSSVNVWTGTSSGGGAGSTCSGWTSTSSTVFATIGVADRSGGAWTASGTQPCNGAARFYCLEMDGGAFGLQPAPREVGDEVYVFVSGGSAATGSVTVDAMDTQCRADASALGLTGSYGAFVSTTSRSATSLTALTGPVVRADGWPIAPSVASLGAEGSTLATSFGGVQRVGAGLSLTSALGVWTGMAMGGPDVVGTQTCTNWTVATAPAVGVVGISDSARFPTWGGGSGALACGTTQRWYCIRNGL